MSFTDGTMFAERLDGDVLLLQMFFENPLYFEVQECYSFRLKISSHLLFNFRIIFFKQKLKNKIGLPFKTAFSRLLLGHVSEPIK